MGNCLSRVSGNKKFRSVAGGQWVEKPVKVTREWF